MGSRRFHSQSWVQHSVYDFSTHQANQGEREKDELYLLGAQDWTKRETYSAKRVLSNRGRDLSLQRMKVNQNLDLSRNVHEVRFGWNNKHLPDLLLVEKRY